MNLGIDKEWLRRAAEAEDKARSTSVGGLAHDLGMISGTAFEPPPSDPIVDRLVAEHRRREALGLAKYGVTLARDDLSRLDWLKHARDEAMDLALYLEKLISLEEQA